MGEPRRVQPRARGTSSSACQRARVFGIFVFSKKTAPECVPPLKRVGKDVLAVWDVGDPSTDLVLEAAMTIAKALCVVEARKNPISQPKERPTQQLASTSRRARAMMVAPFFHDRASGRLDCDVTDRAALLDSREVRRADADHRWPGRRVVYLRGYRVGHLCVHRRGARVDAGP